MSTARLLAAMRGDHGCKDLLSLQQGPPGPSGLPGGNGFRGPPVSSSSSFTEHATTTEERGSFPVSHPVLAV